MKHPAKNLGKYLHRAKPNSVKRSSAPAKTKLAGIAGAMKSLSKLTKRGKRGATP